MILPDLFPCYTKQVRATKIFLIKELFLYGFPVRHGGCQKRTFAGMTNPGFAGMTK